MHTVRLKDKEQVKDIFWIFFLQNIIMTAYLNKLLLIKNAVNTRQTWREKGNTNQTCYNDVPHTELITPPFFIIKVSGSYFDVL